MNRVAEHLRRIFCLVAVFALVACGGGDGSPVYTGPLPAYIKASNTDISDAFGTSVALSSDGNTLAVGAFGEDSSATGINGNQADNTAPAAGAVYIFVRNGAAWTQQAYIKASNAADRSWFGTSVALSADGNTLAVAAAGAPDKLGTVYVFVRSGTTWSEQTHVPFPVRLSDSGLALSGDGDTLAIGNVRDGSGAVGVNGDETDTSAPFTGAVYVFARSGTVWSRQAYVKASNTGVSHAFGTSVTLSGDGNTLAVGASDDSDATGINGDQTGNRPVAGASGAVFVFTRSGTVWSQQAYVKASNTGAADGFGEVALSADGNTLAVGAVHEDSAATGINGTQTNNSAFQAGAVYVFVRNGAVWTQQAYIKASNTEAMDLFGSQLALSGDGNTLAVLALFEASAAIGINGDQTDNSADGAGAVYVFTRSGTGWTQRSYVKASNTDKGDFIQSVALNGNGSTLAMGAAGEDSAARRINGRSDNTSYSSGAVYVY